MLDLGRLFTGGLRGHRSELWSSEWHVLHHDSVPFTWPVKHCEEAGVHLGPHLYITICRLLAEVLVIYDPGGPFKALTSLCYLAHVPKHVC